MKKTIFLVDDNITNLTVAEEALADLYRVIAVSSAARMFTALEKVRPDMILLDIEMPEMNGFEAMKLLRENPLHKKIPVIFLTGRTDVTSEAYGIELGAVDFITKPFSEPVLINRIRHHLNIDEIIRERTEHLQLLHNSIVHIMADLVENHDKNTGKHIERTSEYMRILIKAMLDKGIYVKEITNWNLESVILSARLHDVGKITIPDSILSKPDSLTKDEFDVIKTHPLEGERIINNAIKRTGNAEFLHNAKMIAAYHHERWNGKGYPYALNGIEIPLQGRLMAIIDVYDALVSERPYKIAFSQEEAFNLITEMSGEHFDPLIVEVFVGAIEQIKAVSTKG
jgi:putative two-component system response regulator